MSLRRVLFAFLVLLGLAAPVHADVEVIKGVYSTILRGPFIGGAFVQDTSLVDGVTGARASVVSGSVKIIPGAAATLTESISVRCLNVGGNAFESCGTGSLPPGIALDATLTNGTQRAIPTDGTRDATVKAASTASVVGDTALVVGLSPNSPLPAGQTGILGAVRLTAPSLNTTTPFTHVVAKRITSNTTTTVLAGSASKVTRIYGGSICVDGGGVATTVTVKDDAGSPIDVFSGTTTTTPYQLLAGQCLDLSPAATGTYTGYGTTSGQALTLVTGQAGPVNAVFYLRQD